MEIKDEILLNFIATTGALVAGTGLGWSSNLEDKILNQNDYNFAIDKVEWASISSIMNIAAVIGCITTGIISNAFGRKNTLILISIPFIIGYGFLASAVNLIMLIIGRALLGVACGAICVVGPVSRGIFSNFRQFHIIFNFHQVYVAEIAEKSIRGSLASLFQLQITGGILLVYIIAALASAKVTSLICGGFAVIFLVFVTLIPESPNFYVST